MITEVALDTLLKEILDEYEIGRFLREWILGCPKATVESVRQAYHVLRDYGLSDGKITSQAKLLGLGPETIQNHYQELKQLGISDGRIAAHAHLLGLVPETIQRNHQALQGLGLSDDRISSRAYLLGRDPETIQRNHQALQGLGLSGDKIASQAQLLSQDTETIRDHYQRLKQLGLSGDKIASNAHLIGYDPKTLRRNYQHHVGLLRHDCCSRDSGRDLLFKYAQLLAIPPETIEANVQYMHSISISYDNGFLLGTTPQLKRRKMAWMLRELFGYSAADNREASLEQKRDAVNRLYGFVRDNPRLLIYSLSTLERKKDKLREKAAGYR